MFLWFRESSSVFPETMPDIFSLTKIMNWILYYFGFIPSRSWLMHIIRWELLWGHGRASASARQEVGWTNMERVMILKCCVFLCAFSGRYSQKERHSVFGSCRKDRIYELIHDYYHKVIITSVKLPDSLFAQATSAIGGRFVETEHSAVSEADT